VLSTEGKGVSEIFVELFLLPVKCNIYNTTIAIAKIIWIMEELFFTVLFAQSSYYSAKEQLCFI
jgi:hypothetical protein